MDDTTIPLVWGDQDATVTVPTEYAERVRALVPYCAWGLDFDRRVSQTLSDIVRKFRQGYTTLAVADLVWAEKTVASVKAARS